MVYNPYIDGSILKDMWARYVRYRERSHRLKGSPLFALPVPPCSLKFNKKVKQSGGTVRKLKFIPHPDRAKGLLSR